MRQRLWWQVPLLLLSLLLAGGALRADTQSGIDFASTDWSASDPLASTIAAPSTPAAPGKVRLQDLTTGHPDLEPAPADGVVADLSYEPLLRARSDRTPDIAVRPVDLSHPRLGRAPPQPA
ncbi:hypothetical protein [Pseudonocardia acaciae]|uniref:hypothetical protein n=1 Tax=Pseudonocardia acaciae TaxID=551276 RepID=UPI0004908180|nr:hypothetical protein [Pseudonocardia acaciae]